MTLHGRGRYVTTMSTYKALDIAQIHRSRIRHTKPHGHANGVS